MAIAHTAFVNQIPFLVIRCISDLANEATTEDYKEFEELAAHKSASLVFYDRRKLYSPKGFADLYLDVGEMPKYTAQRRINIICKGKG